MATTTPNFGWPVPTSTDLVKDGAVAIEALGDAVDASLLDLKGGTTGQVLAKATNTDMDFAWVAADDTNAIQNAIVDAKGDLIAASAADTPARLAVGNNGETIVADNSTAVGLRWQTGYNGNAIINGGMDIWQRGTSIAVTSTSTSFYGADRWQIFSGSTGRTVSRQVTGDTTNLPNIQYCQRIQRDSGNTNTAALLPAYSMESADAIRFAGQGVSLSFYARRGANYSATSNALNFVLRTGTGTDQNLNAGYTGSSDAISSTATLTTTWQRFQGYGVVSASATEIGVQFNFTPTGTAGAADYVEITGVQVELGASPTLFKRSSNGTIQGELAACQRYYERIGGQVAGTNFPFANSAATANQYLSIQYKYSVDKRVAPTITKVGTWTVSNCGQPYAEVIQTNYFALTTLASAAGGFSYNPTGTSQYLEISAEL